MYIEIYNQQNIFAYMQKFGQKLVIKMHICKFYIYINI